MFGKGIVRCSEVCWLVGSGMVSYCVGCGISLCDAGFVVVLTVMVTYLRECTFPPLVEIRVNLEVHDLMREDKGSLAKVLALAWVATFAFW